MKQLLTIAFFLIGMWGFSQRKTIPKNYDGGWYYPNGNHGLKPGDTVLCDGNYAYANLNAVIGTAEKPIVFMPKSGQPWFGTNNHYAFILSNSRYVKIIGLKIGGQANTFISQSFSFHGSSDLEVSNCELSWANVGFFSNPSSGDYKNISLHDNYIHDLNNPSEAGRSEGFYIGNTSKGSRSQGGSFENVYIYNNRLENLSGDGIQVALTKNLHIYNNTIKNYGKANLIQQRTAVIVGGCSIQCYVYNNTIQNGTGSPFQFFGNGTTYFANNTAVNCATSANEDGFYIGNRGIDSLPIVHILNNKIDKVARQFIKEEKAGTVKTNSGNQFGGSVAIPDPGPVKVDSVTKASFDSLQALYNTAQTMYAGCNNNLQSLQTNYNNVLANLNAANQQYEELKVKYEALKKEIENILNKF